MIIEKRMSARVDENERFIYFEKPKENALSFDKQIQNFCTKVTQLADYIKK
jgi:hypothetical protein